MHVIQLLVAISAVCMKLYLLASVEFQILQDQFRLNTPRLGSLVDFNATKAW